MNRKQNPLNRTWTLIVAVFLIGLFVVLSILSWEGWIRQATAQMTNSVPTTVYRGATVPDWTRISFATLPAATEAGSFELPSSLTAQLGYNPSRSWQAGQAPATFMMLGDVGNAFGLEQLSLVDIYQRTDADMDLNKISLADLGLMQWQTIGDLVRAIPNLGNFSVRNVEPILERVMGQGGSMWNERIGDIAQQSMYGNLSLRDLDLNQYSLDSIPGLTETRLGNFQSWQQSSINEVPGLEETPFASFPKKPSGYGFVGLLDVVYGPKEARRTNTISGSDVEGFHVPCRGKSCPYIELTDGFLGISSLFSLHGAQWIDGKHTPWVKGGHGVLGTAFGGKEPTGRLPFGETPFKVVLTQTTESTGSAQFGLYFRYCYRGIPDLGCTPYMFGPIPWIPHHEDDIIFVGLTPGSPPSGISQQETPQEVQDFIDKKVGNETPPGMFGQELTDADCKEKQNGVSIPALKQAISNIESGGSGGHQAIGTYVCDSAGLCGRALGKYQFMTYNEQAKYRILKKPGGAEFLRRANSPNNSAAYKQSLSKDVLRYFPVNEQEAARSSWFKLLINKAASEGRSGSSLVGRVGELHNAGIYSWPGSASGYAKRTQQEYAGALKQVSAQCTGGGKCGPPGRFKWPTNAPINSPYGWRNGRMHAGVDMAAPLGTPIRAGNCGTVVSAGWNAGGYGNLIQIKHPDGFLTRYAHNHEILVRPGQKVSLGQPISRMGSTGRSTGPHLHFETRPPGRGAVNPIYYLYR